MIHTRFRFWSFLTAALSLVATLCAAPSARAADGSSQTRTQPGFSASPVGIGALVGESGGTSEYAVVIEGNNHFKQRRGIYDVRQYGHGQSRVEIGNGLGLSFAATSGVTLYGLDRKGGFSPHFGIEPASGRIVMNTRADREDYYEWLPMASVGPQFGWKACRMLPLARAGMAAGNLGRDNLKPAFNAAYGVGAYLNCSKLDIAAEVTRVNRSVSDIDLGLIDVSYSFKPEGLKLGLRAEGNFYGGGTPASALASEKRVLLMVRSSFLGLN